MKAVFLSALGCSLVLGACESTSHNKSNVTDLLQNAPRISLTEPGIESFYIEGTLRVPAMAIRFIVAGEKPDNVSMTLYDMNDGTPIMVGINDACMICDPIAQRVVIGQSPPYFILGMLSEGDDTKLDFQAGVDPARRNSVSIDIGSILATASGEYEITPEDGQSFVAARTTETGNELVAHVSPSRKEGAVTGIELFPKGNDVPVISLSRVELNTPLPENCFSFPEQALRASGVPMTDLLTGDAAELGLLGFTCFIGHSVMDGNADVAELTAVYSGKVDVAQMREAERAYSPILKSVFTTYE